MNKPLEVYRVEWEDGRGPYILDGGHDALQYTQDFDNNKYPRPTKEFPELENKPLELYYFGFSNLTQLKRWFGKAFPFLEEREYMLAVYQVNRELALVGRTQVAFVRDFSKRVFRTKVVWTA